MGERLKILVLVAFLGFIAGVIADLFAEYVFPIILDVLPAIIKVKYVLSGIVGAVLALILVVIWAYATKPKEA
ncbi:MAG: hypothetical protein QXX79_07390 [Candidatus Bathyarchaeia archaeon]